MGVLIYNTDIRFFNLKSLVNYFSVKLSEPIFKETFLYRNDNDKLRHLLGEILSRYAIYHFIQEIYRLPFLVNEKGKPYLPDQSCYFNISHSKNKVVVAVSNKNVGIDVEYLRKGKMDVANRFFSNPEIEDIQSDKDVDYAFTKYWSLKESYLKYIGTGLSKPLNSFTIKKKEGGNYIILQGNEQMNLNISHQVLENDYHLSVCSDNIGISEIIEIDNNLLMDFSKVL